MSLTSWTSHSNRQPPVYWAPLSSGSPAALRVWWQSCCGRFVPRYHFCFEEGGSG